MLRARSYEGQIDYLSASCVHIHPAILLLAYSLASVSFQLFKFSFDWLCNRHQSLPYRDPFWGAAKDYGLNYRSTKGSDPTHIAAGKTKKNTQRFDFICVAIMRNTILHAADLAVLMLKTRDD